MIDKSQYSFESCKYQVIGWIILLSLVSYPSINAAELRQPFGYPGNIYISNVLACLFSGTFIYFCFYIFIFLISLTNYKIPESLKISKRSYAFGMTHTWGVIGIIIIASLKLLIGIKQQNAAILWQKDFSNEFAKRIHEEININSGLGESANRELKKIQQRQMEEGLELMKMRQPNQLNSTQQPQSELPDELEKIIIQLEVAAREVNKVTPKIIDEGTRLDFAVAGPGNVLSYTCTLLDFTGDQYDIARLKSKLKSNLNANYLSDNMKTIRSNNTTIKMIYRDEAQKTIFEIIVNRDNLD